MEHIFQIAISMDDDRIKAQVADKAEKEIIANLTREVGQVIFERERYSYYGINQKGYNPNNLSSWSEHRFEDFLKENKDAIIKAAANMLADRLARTKAGKAILEDLKE